jgi:hypothetical protein
MRSIALALLVAGFGMGQTLTEFGAAAATGTVGGASGKAVSNGVSGILGRLGSQTAKAAAPETQTPELKVGESTAAGSASGDPPAPLQGARARTRGASAANTAAAQASLLPALVHTPSLAEAVPDLPPPPVMTRESLKSVNQGMTRADVLKLGDPSSRITTLEGGHMIEIYSYRENGQKFGGVRLTDGVVSRVDTQ